MVEKAKQWIAGNRDPPMNAEGLRNCIKQLCHYKRSVEPAEVTNWLIAQKLIEDTLELIVYHFERTAPAP